MGSSGNHVFTGISREAFERMKNDLRGMGVTVPEGDVSEIHHRGVSGSIEYSEPDGRVEVRIISKPFFVSSSAVTSMLDRVMRRYVGTAGDVSDSG